MAHNIFIFSYFTIDSFKKNEPSIDDVYSGEHTLDNVNDERYLGDIICKNNKNDKNVSTRVAKGIGIIKQIESILSDICFGKHYFKVAKLLRQALFLNSILLNVEVWYNVTQDNLKELEKVDIILLRKFLEFPIITLVIIIHLEIGTMTIRFIIMNRRLCATTNRGVSNV